MTKRFLSSSSKDKISLYDCLEAKVKDDRIRCAKGHTLKKSTTDGNVPIISLLRGMTLNYAPCQNCPDLDRHDGPPVADKDKGWFQRKSKGYATGLGE